MERSRPLDQEDESDVGWLGDESPMETRWRERERDTGSLTPITSKHILPSDFEESATEIWLREP